MAPAPGQSRRKRSDQVGLLVLCCCVCACEIADGGWRRDRIDVDGLNGLDELDECRVGK